MHAHGRLEHAHVLTAMNGGQLDGQIGDSPHGPLNSDRNVMQLQIQENASSGVFRYPAYQIRPCVNKELQTDFEHTDMVVKPGDQLSGRAARWHIQWI